MIAVICLTILAFALGAALIYREWAHDRERQALLDRIQAPESVPAAAFARALPAQPAIPNTDAEDDARFGRPLDDDFDFPNPEPA